MTPALEAETERLLSQRTRDIRFSPEMVRAYRKKDWPQRSKIARAWMVWVALISMAFVPISFLLAPNSFGSPPSSAGCWSRRCTAVPTWSGGSRAAPRSKGSSLLLLMSSVMIAYGLLAVAAGGSDYERFLTCIMYVNTIAIVVFNVDYVWTLALMACSTGNLFCLRNIQSRDRPRGSDRDIRSSMRWESMRRRSRGKPSRSSVKKPSCCPCATSIAATR